MTRTRLFVYGSLKRGFRHHSELAGAAFEGCGLTAPGFRLVLWRSYPALIPDGDGQVRGEVFSVDSALLARLDEFEEHPDVYQRRVIELADGSTASTYLMTAEWVRSLPHIPDGVWIEGSDDRSP